MPVKIHKRPGSPNWYIRGTVAGTTIKRQSLGVSDKALAEHKAVQLQTKLLHDSVHGPHSKATFGDACLQYFEDNPVKDGERSQMSAWLKPIIAAIGDVKLRNITPVMARSLAKKLNPHYKPQSLNTNVLAPISAVVNNAHQHGLCGPIKIKRFTAEDARIARPIDRDWLDRFMAHAPARLAAFALFQFTTGSRPQEACNLRPDQLNLDKGIGASGKTKNGKRRTYYLVPEMVSVLRKLPPRQIVDGKHAGEFRVFGYVHRASIRLPWIEACKAAGLDYRDRYEAGRHSHFTESITRHRADIPTACKVGNITPAVALRRYAKAEKAEALAHDVFGAKSAQSTQKRFKTVRGSKG
jgi:integrase